MKKITLASMVIAAAAFIGMNSSVFAAEQSNESITMSPTSKRQSVDPGDSVTDTVTVLNSGKAAFDFNVYARPYSVEGEAYKPVFNSTAANTDAHKWVQFAQSKYRLEPGKSVEVIYTMNVPSNADSGGHYAVLFAETEAKSSDGTAVLRNKRVGAILYTTVNGDNVSKGSVLNTDIANLQTNAPITANSRVKNDGNVDFVDKTSITVHNIFGQKKYSETRELAVLPQTTRSIDYTWKNSANIGIYKVTIAHDMLKKKTDVSQYVVLLPVWAIVLIVLGIMGVIYGVVAKQRVRK